MECLKGYSCDVNFVVPEGLSNATYTVSIGGTQIGGSKNATISNGIAAASLPYAAVINEGTVDVRLSFSFESNSVVLDKQVKVVTPILEVYEVLDILGTTDTAEARKAEAAVRLIINSHCGQSFGLSRGAVRTVEGHGERSLRLPARLAKLTGLSTLTAVLNPQTVIVVSDGWYLKKGWSEVVSNIVNENRYFGGGEIAEGPFVPEKISHGPVITTPHAIGRPTIWAQDYPFAITGDWGYYEVPQSVKEAARLLVKDYSCLDAAYRDSYIDSLKSADWTIQFNSRAWDSTGNARADQLLGEYNMLNWVVV